MPEIPEPDWSLVHEVADDTGSHIEPPPNPDWPPLWQLRWKAASIRARTGLNIHIDSYTSINGLTNSRSESYGIAVYPVGHGAMSFRDAWTLLNGIESGAKAHAALVEDRR